MSSALIASTTPVASLIGGAVNGAVTNTRFFGSGGVQGFTRKFGGSYVARFDSTRSTTSNTNAFLNPNYPSLLTFEYTQPLLRNRSTDNNRRQIEIAKKNLSLSDSQFRAQAIEVISRVEQAYWNLAFALRNLQVQIDAVKQARTQLESNERLVSRGSWRRRGRSSPPPFGQAPFLPRRPAQPTARQQLPLHDLEQLEEGHGPKSVNQR